MPQISLREKDSLEFALKKLKRLCDKANIWTAVRKKAAGYEKPTTARKRAKMAAIKRQNKKNSLEKLSTHHKGRPNYYSELRTFIDQEKGDQGHDQA